MKSVSKFARAVLVPLLASAALQLALLSGACGSSSTSLVGPTAQKCQISVNDFTSAFGPSGGSGSATIDTARECSWSATSQTSWIAVTAPGQGTGVGTLSFSVSANPAATPRSGSLAVNGTQLTVSQEAAPCRFAVAPATVNVAAAGGAGSVTVTATGAGCAWIASSQSRWITVTSGSARGNGSVAFVVQRNPGTARTGTLAVAGQLVTVAQAGAADPAPPPTPSPTPVSIHLAGNVSGRKGSCPALSFSVQGVDVVTTAGTAFVGTSCDGIRNGLRVAVDGLQQPGQPVVATRVASGVD